MSCPDCGAILKIDPVTRAIIAHTSAPRKKMFEDFGEAARALREARCSGARAFSRSRVDAEKNKEDVLAKKFAEAVKKAKETPWGSPLRDFDLGVGDRDDWWQCPIHTFSKIKAWRVAGPFPLIFGRFFYLAD